MTSGPVNQAALYRNAVSDIKTTELVEDEGGKKGRGFTREQFFTIVSPLTLLVLWEVLARTGVLDIRIFSAPTAVGALMWEMIQDGTLWDNLSATLMRFCLGTLLGGIPGLLLGLTMGLFRWPRAIVNPLVAAIYPLPRIALFPLILLIVGLNEWSNVLMISMQPFFYMLIGTLAAVLNVEPIYLRVARSYKVSTIDLYKLVVFPAALPIIVSSMRLALGGSLLVTVTVESLMAPNGIGFMIWHSWQTLSLATAMVGLVVAGILGFILIQGLDVLEKHLVPWSGNARNAGR